jgi:hypothetical protein
MGNIELPSPGSKQTIKMPIGTYEFGANLVSEKVSSSSILFDTRLLDVGGLYGLVSRNRFKPLHHGELDHNSQTSSGIGSLSHQKFFGRG